MSTSENFDCPDSPYMQPGSVPDSPSREVASVKMNEKRELRDLNSRLSQYVKSQLNREANIKKLQESLSAKEIEHRNKLKKIESQFETLQNELRHDIQRKQVHINELRDEVENITRAREDLSERLRLVESQKTELSARFDNLTSEYESVKNTLTNTTKEFAEIKYAYENHESERNALNAQIHVLKEKNKTIMLELTHVTSDRRNQQDTFGRLLREKSEEIDAITKKNVELLKEKEDMQEKLRTEFDTKLAEFVKQREEQYKQEKDEWVRIFKEEFNRKIQTFKDANFELSHTNKKQSDEIVDLRNRLAQVKRTKTELEATNRRLEDELEKTRIDIDELRRTKDADLKKKSQLILKMKEQYKAKEAEFDELMSIKGQLTMEIGMFRKILSDAEKTAGYVSPIRSTRKKRRLNSGEDACYETPSLQRAAKFARSVASQFTPAMKPILGLKDTAAAPDDMKDNSEELHGGPREGSVDDSDDTSFVADDMTTPGEVPCLIFSDMDLTESMIEIQNTSNENVSLEGYTLSNCDSSHMFALPKDRVLRPQEKLRIIIGSDVNMKKIDESDLLWGEDVWEGNKQDAARLYDPNTREIARIEIHPEMLRSGQNTGCRLM